MISRIYIPHRALNNKQRKKIYYLEYRFDPMPHPKSISLGTTDKRVAQKKAQDEFARLQQEAAGILQPVALHDGAAKPLSSLLDEYFRDLTARQRSETTLIKYRLMLPRLFKDCGWVYLRDAKIQDFNEWRARGVMQPKTLNLYLGVAKGFFKWLVDNDYAVDNPLRKVKPVKLIDEDKYRRALTHEQLQRLIALAPDMRAFVYRVFYYTGLRHNELHSLTLADFQLDRAEPIIRISASLAKNKRFNLVEVAAAILNDLQVFLANFKNPTDRPFHGLIPKIETLKKDLARADIPFETEQGRFDLHAFRKTLGTHLALADEPPQKIQRILRHETLAMTMKFYTDVSLFKGRESLAKLPVISGRKEPVTTPKPETPAGGTVKADFPGPFMTRNNKIGYDNAEPQAPDDESVGREVALVGTAENDLSPCNSNLSSPTILPLVP